MRVLASSLSAIASLLLTGCTPDLEDFNRAPPLSPVGQGIGEIAAGTSMSEVEVLSSPASSWIGGNADYFRDPRASRKGDLLTVKIGIDDKASLNSSSNRNRKASADGKVGLSLDWMGTTEADLSGAANVGSNSSSAGQGTTTRSERIELSVAAMVTRVMPNGSMLIEGSQEVEVNFEQRILHVSGLVRPVDISPDNSISYEKIAEARISYGGQGRISEVQQPAWGQQIWDRISPF